MSSIKDLNQAISTLNVEAVKPVLDTMSDEQVASINGWMIGFELPYDVALKSTMAQYFKTGDHSLVNTCSEILDLLKQKGWNGIIINGIYGKVSDSNLITLHADHRFDFQDYSMFVKNLTNEVARIYSPTEIDVFKGDANELEDFLHSNPDPLCWKKTELDRMSKNLIHRKAIAAVCEKNENNSVLRCSIQ